MTEEPIKSNSGNGIPELRAPQTPGEWLRTERERQNRTVQQMAEEMHLSIYIVEAMENNQFSVLGASVFARGHLRKYAALLNVPIDRVQELYLALTDRPHDEDPVPVTQRTTEPSKAMSPDSRQRRDEQMPAMWTAAIAIVGLVVISLLVWLFVRNPEAEPAATTSAEPPAESTVAAPPDPVATPPTTTAAPAAASMAAPVQTASQTRPTQVPPRSKLGLRFSFTQESWVEVYDSRGTRLLYDVGLPGQSRSVQVEGPAQIVLGQAGGVSTEVNGTVVEVPAKRVTNQVARFTVGADGSVQ